MYNPSISQYRSLLEEYQGVTRGAGYVAQFERLQILVEMGVSKSRSAQLGNLFPMRGTTLPTNVPTITQGQHRAWCVVQQLIKARPKPSHRGENLV